ncbi:hypothetical protein GCM10011614_35260 [Novosphingobium colocasiae]|uniref:Uncharacterized protein n=1 Tax=Novosphingobium colocasiae TaxID=1256513 RepID=A0A918PNV1_9SPHN|nr:hypothetical protein GCM10011614_35260 [Novosphingobium colocasiae]
MDHGEEVFGELVVSCSNPAEMLQLGEEALDQVALAIEPCAEVRLRSAIGLRRDIGKRSFFAEGSPDAICIVRLVSQQDSSGVYMGKQTVSRLPIVASPSGQA